MHIILKRKNPVIIKFLCIVVYSVIYVFIYLFHRIGLVGAISWLEINKQICDNGKNHTPSYTQD